MTRSVDEQVRRAIIVYDPLVNGSDDVGSARGHESWGASFASLVLALTGSLQRTHA